MAINFTDSPSNGATQTISGRTYTYNSAKNKWDTTATEVIAPTATTYATVNDLPGTATTGAQAFVSATNRLYIWNGSGWYNIALINNTPTWGTQPASSYTLAADGTATVVSIVASDPEGLPITYSITSDTSGSVATVVQGTGLNTNSWTITPSTSDADAGTFSLTFRASDGINIASAVSEFTLQFQVQNSNYTTALITSVGANNAVNNTFIDSSTNSHTITAFGDAHQTTFSPYRHGGYSLHFPGAVMMDLGFSTLNSGNWTFECWAKVSVGGVLLGKYGGGNQLEAFGVHPTTGYMYTHTGAGVEAPTCTNDLRDGNWHYLVWERYSGTYYYWADGTLEASFANTETPAASANWQLGGGQSHGGFTGNMKEARFSLSTAVYTGSAPTTPTEPQTTPRSTDAFFTGVGLEVKDYSSNNRTFTPPATLELQPTAPYDYNQYSSAINGGSMYFDGSGDTLTIPGDASYQFGTGDFTIEFWWYPRSATTPQYILMQNFNDANNGYSNWLFYVASAGSLVLYSSSTGSSWNVHSGLSIGSYILNQWSHVAITRESGSLKTFINGILNTTVSNTADYSNSGGVRISSYNGTNDPAVQASISNLRLVKGTAVYTSAFTPPTAPLTAITNTSLLLKGTNAGIIDKAQSNKLLTLTGNTKSSTTQTKYLSSSMYFDGSGDNIYTDVLTTAGDFTVEMWIRFDGQIPNPANQSPTFFVWGTTTFMLYATSTTGVLNMIGNGSGLISSSTAMTADTWHHVAFARQGSTGRLFLNGTLEGSTTSFSTNLNARAVIGSEESLGYPFKGYMSDVRITKGLARYTSNFTAPAAALKG
jgi:hypothetical protein